MAAPLTTTKYHVSANLGKCQQQDSITIRVSPYPEANAGKDTAICFGDKVQLHGTVTALNFSWTPSAGMLNAGSLLPFVAVTRTTAYVLTAKGYDECPKTVKDTVVITVIPQVKAFAGRDTIVTGDETLTLNASGGENYQWSPTSFMDNSSIPNPTITLSNLIDSIIYHLKVTTVDGCVGEDDIKIVVFKTGPQIFVPDAFTPNHDGKNDGLYPVLVGMKQLNSFRVYNRLGQLVFTTSEIGKSWDGTLGGREQPTGTFVYMAEAVNYKGEVVFKKGTVLLIR
jgi:gliding motility-associated-like protein